MKPLLCLFLSYFVAAHYTEHEHPPPPGVFCNDGWTFYQNKCFRGKEFERGQRNSWFHAEVGCEGMGGKLATIRTKEEYSFIHSKFIQNKRETWIGYRQNVNNSYFWTAGDTGFLQFERDPPQEICSLNCFFLHPTTNYGSSKTMCCTATCIGSFLCSTDAVRCPTETSDFAHGKCSCKSGFVDILDTDEGNPSLFTRGEKCIPKNPCTKLNNLRLVFVIDESDSGAKYWKKIRSFIQSASQFLSPANTGLGFVNVKTDVSSLPLKYHWSEKYFRKALPKDPAKGDNRIPVALSKAKKLFRNEAGEGVVVLVTAGPPKVEGVADGKVWKQMLHSTKELRASLKFFVVGVYGTMDRYETQIDQWIEGKTNYFAAKNMDSADMNKLLNRICIPLLK